MKTSLMGLFDKIIPFLIPVLATGLGWMLARRKNDAELRKTNAETDHIDLENLEKHIGLYKHLLDDFSLQVVQLRQQVFEFAQENSRLKNQVVEFVKENGTLKIEIELLTRKVNELERVMLKT